MDGSAQYFHSACRADTLIQKREKDGDKKLGVQTISETIGASQLFSPRSRIINNHSPLLVHMIPHKKELFWTHITAQEYPIHPKSRSKSHPNLAPLSTALFWTTFCRTLRFCLRSRAPKQQLAGPPARHLNCQTIQL